MDESFKLGQIVRDEEGRPYQLIASAEHEDDHREFLIYQKLFDDFKVMARTVKPAFMSAQAVESKAEPEYTEAPVGIFTDLKAAAADGRPAKRGKRTATELMMDFLDERDFDKKQMILDEMALMPDLSDSIIDNLAAALDIVIDEGPVDSRFLELRSCVRTRAHYELSRFR